MILDLLSPDSSGTYNRKLARLTSLTTACYWDILLQIMSKVMKKKKFDPDGWFEVSRKYITEQTAIQEEDQLMSDTVLQKLEVLDIDPDNKNRLRARLSAMVAILTDDSVKDLNVITKIAKVSRAAKTESKKTGIIHRLQSRINQQDEEVQKMFESLIEIIYDKGVCTNAQIDLYQKTLDEFTADPDVKKAILKIAIASGYRDCQWSIDAYKRDHKTTATKAGTSKKCSGVSDVSF